MKTLALLSAAAALLVTAAPAFAEIKSETVTYKDGDTVLEGVVVYDDANDKPRPGVLVVHDWTGLQDYAKLRASLLAELGYVAFCADIYGKGVRPNDPKECAAVAGGFKKDLPLLRKRVTLALDELKKQKLADKSKVAAIGYCFGGTTVLELARGGADLNGVVSFHGNLATSMPAKEGGVKASVLVLHGADDPFVKPPEVEAFKAEMSAAKAKMEFVAYEGAVHSFTKEAAGDDKSKGSAYDVKADTESWAAMKKFFAKILK